MELNRVLFRQSSHDLFYGFLLLWRNFSSWTLSIILQRFLQTNKFLWKFLQKLFKKLLQLSIRKFLQGFFMEFLQIVFRDKGSFFYFSSCSFKYISGMLIPTGIFSEVFSQFLISWISNKTIPPLGGHIENSNENSTTRSAKLLTLENPCHKASRSQVPKISGFVWFGQIPAWFTHGTISRHPSPL